jgi:hypothetical protein
MSTQGAYYIPHKATWPIAATIGLMTLLAGFANYLNGNAAGSTLVLPLIPVISHKISYKGIKATANKNIISTRKTKARTVFLFSRSKSAFTKRYSGF